MEALQLTYNTLATTRNEAAVEVLLSVLDNPQDTNRRIALQTLSMRTEPRAPESLLAKWGQLQSEDLRTLRPKKDWLTEAVENALGQSGESLLIAIRAADDLGITSVASQLILLAESSGSNDVQLAANRTVMNLAESLGRDARQDRGQTASRSPVLTRLADSVRRFSMHRNDQMVEAFLLVSTWGDADLRQMLGQKSSERTLLCKCMKESTHPGVMELLAGFIRRRNLPPWLSRIIVDRKDEAFRDLLLTKIGSEPTASTLRNLSEMGRPDCCNGDEAMLPSVPPQLCAALVHVYNETSRDTVATLNLIAAVIETGTNSAISAGAVALGRGQVAEAELWMRAAIPVADNDLEAIAVDDTAKLLKRMIDLLSHQDAAVVRGARRVLAPLHADQMMARFQSLRPRSRRRLGRVVMMIDSDAIDRVKDGLRHPVLGKRMDAIAMADALAIVDLLSDSFAHIAREDHQEARSRAAEAMADAESDVTLNLLQEMVSLPSCLARDAAVNALQQRKTSKTRN